MANKPRTCRAVEANVGVRNSYSKALFSIQKSFNDFVLKQILIKLNDQSLLAEDSAFTPKTQKEKNAYKAIRKKVLVQWARSNPQDLKNHIDGIVSANLTEWLSFLGTVSTQAVRKFVRQVVLTTSQAQKKALISANFNKGLIAEKWTVPVVKNQYISPEAMTLVESAIKSNVELITNIGSQDVNRISDVLIQGLTEGKNDDELRAVLQNTQGFDKGRVERVVLDQTNKLNQAVQTANANSLGITEAIWKHVPGQYSSRKTHEAMNGQRFKINEGIYDPAVQRNVKCGELPFCRCQMRLIFKREQTNE